MNPKEAVFDVPLRWGDMDAMGHLNNVVYFRLMEEARVQWLAGVGCAALPKDEAPILAHVECDFVRAMTYPAVARVVQRITRVGQTSVEFSTVIEAVNEPGVTYAKGRAVVVWYDYTHSQSKPWPESVRALIA